MKIRRAFIFILVIGLHPNCAIVAMAVFIVFHDSNRTYTVMTLLVPMCNK
ncbi:hypothetical protein EAHG_02913 [Escherichia coli B671]|nr:hypothetical protein EAHG_02913 [Escherichia coli B671]